MNLELKVKLQRAIDRVIIDGCEDGLWEYLIHPELIEQMTNAAELIFDSAQDAQEYHAHENCIDKNEE
jgi:hypothetical protein